MKIFILFVIVIFCGSMIAQSQTISDPKTKSTITPKQIKALGQQYQYPANGVIVLDFEGLGNDDPINNFYNGGTSGYGNSGANYGIEFGDAIGLIDFDAGGTGNFANEPSPSTIMVFMDANQAYLNVAAGFTTGFSFYYSSFSIGAVSVYDGLSGTGSLLATVNLPSNFNLNNCTGDPDGLVCNWDPIGVAIAGTAKSVVFSGGVLSIGFDDITFGSLTPGGTGGTCDLVEICHIPPGNQNNPQTLCISPNAVAAHLAHGDVLGPCAGVDNLTGIEDLEENLQVTVSPNPFTDHVTMNVHLASDANVEISIYSISGLKVNTLHSGNLSHGDHTFVWKGDNYKGSQVSKGMYILRINHRGIIEHHKLLRN